MPYQWHWICTSVTPSSEGVCIWLFMNDSASLRAMKRRIKRGSQETKIAFWLSLVQVFFSFWQLKYSNPHTFSTPYATQRTLSKFWSADSISDGRSKFSSSELSKSSEAVSSFSFPSSRFFARGCGLNFDTCGSGNPSAVSYNSNKQGSLLDSNGRTYA